MKKILLLFLLSCKLIKPMDLAELVAIEYEICDEKESGEFEVVLSKECRGLKVQVCSFRLNEKLAGIKIDGVTYKINFSKAIDFKKLISIDINSESKIFIHLFTKDMKNFYNLEIQDSKIICTMSKVATL